MKRHRFDQRSDNGCATVMGGRCAFLDRSGPSLSDSLNAPTFGPSNGRHDARSRMAGGRRGESRRHAQEDNKRPSVVCRPADRYFADKIHFPRAGNSSVLPPVNGGGAGGGGREGRERKATTELRLDGKIQRRVAFPTLHEKLLLLPPLSLPSLPKIPTPSLPTPDRVISVISIDRAGRTYNTLGCHNFDRRARKRTAEIAHDHDRMRR